MTTPQAKGLLPEDHPLSLRGCGMGASAWARRYLTSEGGPDVTLVLGSDLDDVAICGTPPVADHGFLCHVDLDAAVFGRNAPTALALQADLGAVARALTEGAAAPLCAPEVAARVRALKTEPASAYDDPDFQRTASSPIAPQRAVADLQAAAGPGAIFVSDIGEHMLFALHYLHIGAAEQFVIHLGLGSMGSGIGSAIGLAMAAPGRRVVCLCGDGGMQMVGMELLVAIKLRLPIVYAVFNDARYNMVYHGYRLTFGREAAWDTPVVDFAAWARALGARGARIEHPGQLDAALLDRLTADDLPAVLDIRHDAEVRARGGRAEAVRDMLG